MDGILFKAQNKIYGSTLTIVVTKYKMYTQNTPSSSLSRVQHSVLVSLYASYLGTCNSKAIVIWMCSDNIYYVIIHNGVESWQSCNLQPIDYTTHEHKHCNRSRKDIKRFATAMLLLL